MPLWRSIDPRARVAPPFLRLLPELTPPLLLSPTTDRAARPTPWLRLVLGLASFLRLSPAAGRVGHAASLLRLVLGLTLLLPVSPATDRVAHAAPTGAGFVVEHAALRAVDGRYVADARIDFAFSDDNLEAMRNGVALTVIVDIEVRRERGPLWNETLAERKLRYRIETNVLTERYRIRDLVRRSTRHYRSFEEMVDALGRVESVPVAAGDRLPPGVRCTARVRARLDIEALPSPLRPLAYFSPQWRLSSGWFEWPVER